MGCDKGGFSARLLRGQFQSTHPHGVRQTVVRFYFNQPKFQSTHPHGVRLPIICVSRGNTRVSIHAPAWGATTELDYLLIFCQFQSTHPHGVRQRLLSGGSITPLVSIHAPAWGATCRRLSVDPCLCKFQSTHPHGVRPGRQAKRLWSLCFNPRTRMGCDGKNPFSFNLEKQFQSTHPHGVRHVLHALFGNPFCFNPRTRMGCDSAA